MSLPDLTDPNVVLKAVHECDALGRDALLHKYGFGRAHEYFLVVDDREYDSKAIVGVAYGFQFPGVGPLSSAEFLGGKHGAAKKLRALGFEITRRRPT